LSSSIVSFAAPMNHPQEIEETLFEAITELETPAAQRVFLELVRHGDAAQAKRLEDLLEAQSAANQFFRKAEVDRTLVGTDAGAELIALAQEDADLEALGNDADDAPGKQIGRYRLLQRIGEGGCGVVYLAEQEEPVQRQVALKVIRLGMDTERVISRFEIERQALAMMDHPNIARVLDAGATATGRPFFVMEWVRGLRITDYCNERGLDIRQRIDLFIEVCRAIQHAHQKGVIHRDIKPSNVLVATDNGTAAPKVIDFGIAKAIQGNPRENTALTGNDQALGTPAYMSPEQADQKQQDIDTRSDVYSLGMLLYELLVGRAPFESEELNNAGLTEMRRILSEREPPAPSFMLANFQPKDFQDAAMRLRLDPSRLIPAIRGDLDSVVMKAIEKDRRHRYETVNGFVMDLQRYIAHEPVLARPQNHAYLLRKFIRRNRLAVGAALGISLSLLLGLGLASSFYLREKHAKQEQVRLRNLAELAHAEQLKRLAEARGWEDFAQISILLSENKITEADEKLRETPLSSIQLSPQSSGVLRSLGNWNALRGRWSQASECFMMLVRADDASRVEPLTSSLDLLACGPVITSSGNHEDYQNFRNWALTRFGAGSKLLEIQRVLHATLLTPADDEFLHKLGPLKARLESAEFDPEKTKDGWGREFAIWRAFALALLEYRQNDFERSKFWAENALAFNASRNFILAAIEPIHAMASFQLGEKDLALASLNTVRARVNTAFSPELAAAYEPLGKYQGFWWDWVIARILFREAEVLIEGNR
jgi:hypothetical protein